MSKKSKTENVDSKIAGVDTPTSRSGERPGVGIESAIKSDVMFEVYNKKTECVSCFPWSMLKNMFPLALIKAIKEEYPESAENADYKVKPAPGAKKDEE